MIVCSNPTARTSVFGGDFMDTNVNFDFNDELNLSQAEFEANLKQLVSLKKSLARLKGAPTAEFDKTTGRAYLLYADGRKVYNG